MKVLLISEKTLKQDGYMGDNVSGDFIQPSIQSAQDIDLQQIIGTKLLDKLCAMVDDGSITGSTDYKKFLDDYVTPYLCNKVMAKIQMPITFKTRNLGTITTSSDNVNVATMGDAQKMKEYYDNEASFYAGRISKYLCANSQKFPEYRSTDSVADYRASNSAFYCPILLK